MTKEETRTRVEAELITGKEPRELSTGANFDKYGVPYITILNWKKKLMAEKPSEAVSDLTQQTTATLEVIREVAKEKAPMVASKIDKIIDGVEGLKTLEPKFQQVMLSAVTKAQEYLLEEDLSIKEWATVTSTLAQAYTALFNKSGTTVNVANNNMNVAKENMEFFKSNQRKV